MKLTILPKRTLTTMGNQLNEAFVVSGKLDQRGNNIAYIDSSKPENEKSFAFKDIVLI